MTLSQNANIVWVSQALLNEELNAGHDICTRILQDITRLSEFFSVGCRSPIVGKKYRIPAVGKNAEGIGPNPTRRDPIGSYRIRLIAVLNGNVWSTVHQH